MKETSSVRDSLNSHFGEEYIFFESMIALFVLIRTCCLKDKNNNVTV